MMFRTVNITNISSDHSGWLYMFETKFGVNCLWDCCKIKIGMTRRKLHERIYEYKNHQLFTNISAIQCSLPAKRERLMKAFFKHCLSWKAVDGVEYFDQPYLEILYYLEYFALANDELIHNIHNIYDQIHELHDFFQTVPLFSTNLPLKFLPLNCFSHDALHNQNLLFECILCDEKSKKKFATQNGLNQHMRLIHNTIDTLKHICDVCKKHFTRKSHLTQHKCMKNQVKIQNNTINNNIIINDNSNHQNSQNIQQNIFNIQPVLHVSTNECHQEHNLLKSMVPMSNKSVVENSQAFLTRIAKNDIILTSTDVLLDQLTNNEFANTLCALDKSRDKVVYIDGENNNKPVEEKRSKTYINYIQYGIENSPKQLDTYKELIEAKWKKVTDIDETVTVSKAKLIVTNMENMKNRLDFKEELGKKLAQKVVELKNINLMPKTLTQIESDHKYKLQADLQQVLTTQINMNATKWFLLTPFLLGQTIGDKLKQKGYQIQAELVGSLKINSIIFDIEELIMIIKQICKLNLSKIISLETEFCVYVDEYVDYLKTENDTCIDDVYDKAYSCYLKNVTWLQHQSTSSKQFNKFEEELQQGLLSCFQLEECRK
jgi:hypothetical protein